MARGGVHGRGVFMARGVCVVGGMHGQGVFVAGGCVWPEVDMLGQRWGISGGGMCGQGVCMARGVHGGVAWPGGMCGQGAGMAGGCMAREVCVARMPPPPDTMRYGGSMSGWYASYWNAFLLNRFSTSRVKFWTVNFCIYASKGPVIIMHQLKSFYNSPFKDSYSHPSHTCFAVIASNVLSCISFVFVYFVFSFLCFTLIFQEALFTGRNSSVFWCPWNIRHLLRNLFRCGLHMRLTRSNYFWMKKF